MTRSVNSPPSGGSFDLMSPRSGKDSNVSIRSELSDLESPDVNKFEDKRKTIILDNRAATSDKEQNTDSVDVRESGTATATKKADLPVTSTPSKLDASEPVSNVSSETFQQEENENIDELSKSSNISSQEVTHYSVISNAGEKTVNSALSSVIHSNENDSIENTHTDNIETNDSERFERHFSVDDGFEEFARSPRLGTTLAHIVATTPELEDMEDSLESQHTNSSSRTPARNNDSIFDELAVDHADIIGDMDYGADITGRRVSPGDYASSVSDNFFGMGKELENIILENNELLATKNALNIVKDDLIAKVDELTSEHEILREEITSLQTMKSRLQQRVTQLEEDLKKSKEDLEKKNNAAKEDEEGELPLAQRKRFTRVEMARVLMERNQYKERLMELQEAVRWTEMIRASREHPELSAKKKSSIWNFFSNLFSSSNKPNKKPLPAATVKYSAPTTLIQPVGDPNKKQRGKYNLGDKAKAYDFLQEEVTSEKAKKEREKERREQYKQVRAHVCKESDGRLQAYGWSLPAKLQPHVLKELPAKNQVPVPVPVYCRPLLDKQSGLKIWCAAGVNLTGGRTKDGGSIVGASVFYSNPPDTCIEKEAKDDVDKLDKELKDHERNVKTAEEEQLSSLLWICTSLHSTSSISVINANNPGEILETFRVSSTPILCIASVPGSLESDYPVGEELLKADAYPQYNPPASTADNTSISETSGIGGISLVQCATGSTSPSASPVGSPQLSRGVFRALLLQFRDRNTPILGKFSLGNNSISAGSSDNVQPTVFKAKGSPPSSGRGTPVTTPSSTEKRFVPEHPDIIKDGLNCLSTDSALQYEEVEKMSSMLPTMWLGSQTGSLYVHSAVAQWRRCLHSVKLGDSVLNIVCTQGRVLVALADGTVAIFHRSPDGQWDLKNYHLLDLGRPHHSIRCMAVIAYKHVWCGYRNKIHVVDPQSMTIVKSFDAHPRKESQVRQLAWLGDGVWVSIRLDSTLRLYHAYTYQHLQDVDIEPYVSKMLGTGKLGFSFVRITSMLISCCRLWIGTGNGVIISVPLSENNKQALATGTRSGRPGGIIRVYSDTKTDSVTPGSFIPYCSMAQAQLSFHGHKDAVKFFAAVPGNPRKGMSAACNEKDNPTNQKEAQPALPSDTKLVISGGEGYVDFRIGDVEDEDPAQVPEKKASISGGDRSHLIVWEVSAPV
ncbi:hypothetical protein ScPMuIL_010169 [Solemya velum]